MKRCLLQGSVLYCGQAEPAPAYSPIAVFRIQIRKNGEVTFERFSTE